MQSERSLNNASAAMTVLDAVCNGEARIERSQTTDLVELCYDGKRYPVSGNWKFIAAVIRERQYRDSVK